MATLVYSMMVSLDGYIETPDHSLDWIRIDEPLHRFANNQARETSLSIYGRRLWDVMEPYWPTAEDNPEAEEVEREFSRIWKGFRKVVVSRSMPAPSANAELWRSVDFDQVRELKRTLDGKIEVGGANLAGQFLAAGVVDEVGLFVQPVILGDGTPMFSGGGRIEGELIDTAHFDSGVQFLHYRLSPARAG
jgi:dihydrofolate reductase